MTYEQKELVFALLRGDCYLRPKKSPNGKYSFMIYSGNQKPVKYVTDNAYKAVKEYVKKDKSGKITLNLTVVRQLHGNNHIKKQYKLLKTKLC